MSIYLLDIYRSPNIGVFIKGNDEFIFIPSGLSTTKTSKLSNYLEVKPIQSSISGSRLNGALSSMNSKGILVSKLTDDRELLILKKETGLNVARVPGKYTSIGNLIVANDNGAIASPILSEKDLEVAKLTLNVPIKTLTIADYFQVGSMLAVTNKGAIIHPNASKEELKVVSATLSVDVEQTTINGGVPFVSSGLIANSRNVIAGNITTGPELMMLSRAFKV